MKKLRYYWLFLTKALLLCLMVLVLPYSWSQLQTQSNLQNSVSRFSEFYPNFEADRFAENRENRIYQKGDLNNFLVQILDYFENRDTFKPVQKDDSFVYPKYREIFNLLPRLLSNFTSKTKVEQQEPAATIFLIFSLLLETDSKYTLRKFLPTVLQILRDFKTKNTKLQPKSTSQIEDELLSITKEEFDSFDEIKNASDDEKVEKMMTYLSAIFQDSGFVSNENELNFTFQISAQPDAKYSKKWKIKQDIEKREQTFSQSGATAKLEIKDLQLDFDIQVAPTEFKITFKEDLRFDYYQLLVLMTKLVKFIYQDAFSNDDEKEWKLDNLNREFKAWMMKSNDEKSIEIASDESANDEITQNARKILNNAVMLFLLTKLSFTFEINKHSQSSTPVSLQELVTHSKKNLFDFIEILTTTPFAKDKNYLQLTTRECKISEKDPLLKINLRWLVVFTREKNIFNPAQEGEDKTNYGGLCVTPANEETAFTDQEIIFQLFAFYRALIKDIISIIPLSGIFDGLENWIDQRFKKQIAQQLANSLPLNTIATNLTSLQKSFLDYATAVTEFNPESVDKTNQVLNLTNYFYQVVKENEPFIDEALVSRFDFFYTNNKDQIKQILSDTSQKQTVAQLTWKNLEFKIVDLFVKEKNGQNFLVFMIKDSISILENHNFVLSDLPSKELKIVYYAPNHYEHLIDQFLTLHYSASQT